MSGGSIKNSMPDYFPPDENSSKVRLGGKCGIVWTVNSLATLLLC